MIKKEKALLREQKEVSKISKKSMKIRNKRYKIRRVVNKQRKKFPLKFPFWARLKISKNRTTLIIDDEATYNKKSRKFSNNFVHREATHTYKKDYEEVKPNPDKNDNESMYLKRPRKHSQDLFKPHNKNLTMPERFAERYSKNNKKIKK